MKQGLGLFLLLTLVATTSLTGCRKRPDETLGRVTVNGGVELAIYATYGSDHGLLGLEYTAPNARPLFFMLRFSSYDGFPPSTLKILHSKSKNAVWLVGRENNQEDFMAYLNLTNESFINKYGKLLRPSTQADTEYPEYRSAELPSISADSVEVLAINYGR